MGGARVSPGQNDSVFRRGASQACFLEETIVAGCEFSAMMIPLGEITKFDFEDGGLDRVEAGVPAYLVVKVAARHAMRAERTGPAVELQAGCGDETSVAEGCEVFCGIEAEGGGVTERAGWTPIPRRSKGLGGVFQKEDSGVIALQGSEAIPIGALAVEVDGDDSFDRVAFVAAKKFGDAVGREVEGAGVNVGE